MMSRWKLPIFVGLTWFAAYVSSYAGLPDVLPTGGVNLGPYKYWEPATPFIDYAKMAAGWLSSDGQSWSDDRPLDVNDLGYPVSLLDDQIARGALATWSPGGRGR